MVVQEMRQLGERFRAEHQLVISSVPNRFPLIRKSERCVDLTRVQTQKTTRVIVKDAFVTKKGQSDFGSDQL
jgi:hypothetical protein